MLGLLVSAFVLGFMVAIPPGSVTIVAAQRTLRFGLKNGLVFQLGSCVADALYIVLVYVGVATFIAENRALRSGLWLASGALLAWMAWDALKPCKPATADAGHPSAGTGIAGTVSAGGRRGTFLSGIGVTLLNPVTVVGWIALAGNFFLLKKEEIAGSPDRFFLVLAATILGVQAWLVPLLWAVGRTGAFLGDRAIRILIRVSGVFLASLSGLAFWSLVKEVFAYFLQ
jgi:threonine/homoserine/homoserine lactone efflux protein